MSEIENISHLLGQTCAGAAWYGPSLRRLLADVTAQEASARTVPGAHSIWQQVLHLIAWREVACGLLAGGRVTGVPDERNWPVTSDTSESAWTNLLEELEQSQHRLGEAVSRFPDERLHTNVPGHAFSFYGLLHGVMQHDAYHAGQIAVLRNARG